MPSILLEAPETEPITLGEAKAFLRVEHDDEDDVIAALIASARMQVEAQTRRALITQEWRIVRDGWPADGFFVVTPAPLQAVVAARLRDAEGAAHIVDHERFMIDAASARLIFPPWSLPAPLRAAAGIEIDVRVGYGDEPADVPEPLRHAVRLLVSHWYDNRGLVAIGQSVALMPGTVAALLTQYRAMSL
ncbi:MAG TPA: head-tail connector protein [Xanthobacteraceae bacterium]|nr:head-tail connector protein [Xanthobacteraceae bacterium]